MRQDWQNRRAFLGMALAVLSVAGCDWLTSVTPVVPGSLEGKSVLLVIYPIFEEQEYGKTREALDTAGADVTVASSSLGSLTGSGGTVVQVTKTLAESNGADYDAVVFIGGYAYDRDDQEAIRVAQEAFAAGKVVAAICVAPVTLAKAGVLNGKQATTSLPAAAIQAYGAIYTGALVQRDGKIVTGNGPFAAAQFGSTVVTVLQE